MAYQKLLGGSLFKNEVPPGSKKPVMGNGKVQVMEDIRKGEEVQIGLWKGIDQNTQQPFISFSITRAVEDQQYQQPPQQQYQPQQQPAPQQQYQQPAPAPVAQPRFQEQAQQIPAPGQPPMVQPVEDDVPF